jgi:hypothetical protein
MSQEQHYGALTITAFCQGYGVGRSRCYEMIAAGSVEARKFGAKTLITRESAERWFQSLPGFSPAPRIQKMRQTMAMP